MYLYLNNNNISYSNDLEMMELFFFIKGYLKKTCAISNMVSAAVMKYILF